MNSQVWWFVARSSGIIAWGLLTLSVCWGLLLSTRVLSRRVSPAWVLDLHRHLGGLAVVFTGVHLVGLVADSYVTFGWVEILVPMASSWEPGAVAFGVVAFYLLLAVELTSLAMRRLPRSLWRLIHRSSFVLFGFATYHGIAAGTDAGNQWFRLTSWASIVMVTLMTAWLVVVARRTRSPLSSLPPTAVRRAAELPPPSPLSVPAASSASPMAMEQASPARRPTPSVGRGASLAPLGAVEPFVPEAPIGPVVPIEQDGDRPLPAPKRTVTPPLAPLLLPLPPPTPTSRVDPAPVSVGALDAGVGEPPTTAT